MNSAQTPMSQFISNRQRRNSDSNHSFPLFWQKLIPCCYPVATRNQVVAENATTDFDGITAGRMSFCDLFDEDCSDEGLGVDACDAVKEVFKFSAPGIEE